MIAQTIWQVENDGTLLLIHCRLGALPFPGTCSFVRGREQHFCNDETIRVCSGNQLCLTVGWVFQRVVSNLRHEDSSTSIHEFARRDTSQRTNVGSSLGEALRFLMLQC